MRLNLGKANDEQVVGFDLPTLIETRALVVANSGGGKSYALRKLLETTHGSVQQIVIDLEGEFSTLRERFDYIVVGKGGDVPAAPKTAELLAQRLLELQVSAICDLYELKAHDRVRFVRLFLEGLMKAPKSLYHPVMIVIDEAHLFAPQQGDCESYAAVIDLCTRGRKRGFCAVLATQRLSKLHKDACAELLNKMIGRTSLDIDQKRAADELGFIGKEDRLGLRMLRPGEFHVYGPALRSNGREETGVISFRVGEVLTRHPKVGARQIELPPAPTARVKEVLGKLVDLAQEAERKERTEAELKGEISDLKRKLTIAEKGANLKPCGHEEELARLRAENKLQGNVIKSLHVFKKSVERRIVSMQQGLTDLQKTINDQLAGHFLDEAARIQERLGVPKTSNLRPKTVQVPKDVKKAVHVEDMSLYRSRKERSWEIARNRDRAFAPKITDPTADITNSQQKILNVAAWIQQFGISPIPVGMLAAHAGYSAGGGAFNNLLSRLNVLGFIRRPGGGMIELTPTGEAVARPEEHIDGDVIESWYAKIGNSKARMLKLLVDDYPNAYTKAELAEKLGEAAGGGAFNNKVSALKTLGLVEYPAVGMVKASELLFVGAK